MIFELQSRTNYYSIEPQLDIQELFDGGKRLAERWQKVVAEFSEGLSMRKVGDFPTWGSIPVFSELAAGALGEMLKSSGELLPLQCSGVPLWAYNVTRIVDALNEDRSDLKRFPTGRVMHISRYEFEASRLPADLAVFKLPAQHSWRVYVTEIFVKAVEAAGLKGFKFEQLWPLEPRIQIGMPPAESLDELMERDARDELEDDFDSELWRLLCDRISTFESLEAWPKEVRAYFASRLLEWEVGNGGFAQAAMNIPEWFEEAAKGYELLCKPRCAALIRKAAVLAQREAGEIARARVSLEKAFEYFDEGGFEKFDSQLDEIRFWSDSDRVDFVRANRDSFSNGKQA